MSGYEDETFSTVSEVITEHVEKAIGEALVECHEGAMLTGFTLTVRYLDEDGDVCWAQGYPDGQDPAFTLGMLRWQTLAAEGQVSRYFEEME